MGGSLTLGPWRSDQGHPIEVWDFRYLKAADAFAKYSMEDLKNACYVWFENRLKTLNQLGALAPYVVVDTAGCPITQILRDAWANRKLAMLAQEVCEAVQPHTHEVGLLAQQEVCEAVQP